jgi:catechol 2,3-dioxygenase-like lactoylglutathione lyase family enzyme
LTRSHRAPNREGHTAVKLDHLRVDVRDLAVAERFYREALGLSEVVRYVLPDCTILQLAPDGTPPGVELWWEQGLTPRPSRTEHLAFAVADVSAAVEKVRSLGYQVHTEPYAIGEETVGFVRDPDGHLIEFNDFRGR